MVEHAREERGARYGDACGVPEFGDPGPGKGSGPGFTGVAIVPYRPPWPESARVLIEVLRAALHPMARRIEHIGRTAIPGMAAKDILDIQVSVADLKDVDEAFDPPLFALGFERSPYRFDHVPAGGAHEPTRWEKRLWSRRGHVDGAVNLHTRIEGSPNERLALLFRDWFRAHPEAVPENVPRPLAGREVERTDTLHDRTSHIRRLAHDRCDDLSITSVLRCPAPLRK